MTTGALTSATETGNSLNAEVMDHVADGSPAIGYGHFRHFVALR
jgi:hypothetical protein